MKIEQKKWTPSKGWERGSTSAFDQAQAALVMVFSDRLILSDPKYFEEIKQMYPKANIILASTSGNIFETTIDDQSIVTTAIAFEKPSSRIETRRINILEVHDSFKAGERLGSYFPQEGLKHILLFSDGHLVNGSNLIKGLLKTIPSAVAVTGGLAGDGRRFEKTLVGIDAPPQEGEIVAVGFYGDHLKFGFGSMGGWDPFGIERSITRSNGNILYELDGISALDIYKNYLGDQAKELPGSALLFPLQIRQNEGSAPLVRTILSVDEKNKSMIFAGDIPQGWFAQLMKANFDRLVDGASQAASSSHEMLGKQTPDLALLISCVGRRIVLDQRTEEEVESVQDVIGKEAIIAGFYSYGEIAPTSPQACCELHNQTMTITTIAER